MEPITARFSWTFEDIRTGRKLVKKPGNLGLLLITGVAVACCAILLIGAPSGRSYPLGTNLIILGIFSTAVAFGAIALFLTRKIETSFARSKFSNRPDANCEVEWKFSEFEIHSSTDHSKSELKWIAFYKVISTPEGFIFMPNAEIFHFIPKRAFQSDEDINSLIALARRHASDFRELK